MRLSNALDHIFAGRSRVRILRALDELPDGIAVSARELARRSGLSHPTVPASSLHLWIKASYRLDEPQDLTHSSSTVNTCWSKGYDRSLKLALSWRAIKSERCT